MTANLDELLAAARERIELLQRSADRLVLREQAERHTPRGFAQALKQAYDQNGFAIIGELKKASPSKGVIRGSFPVGGIADELEKAGAAALSVLTEEKYFHGSLPNLCEASAATELPCLRKDFILHELQVLESRANRADAILLILAALNDAQLKSLASAARELGLDVLCEVHDERELDRALRIECEMVGVNSRNLRNFQVDHGVLRRLASRIPTGLRVAESGISHGAEIRELADFGYQAFLIGESLMRDSSPGGALTAMIAQFHAASAPGATAPSKRRGA